MSRTLLCVPLKGPSYREAAAQAAQAASCADLVEWRFDLFSSLDLQQIAAIKKTLTIPSLFTLRPQREGGNFQGSEQERLERLQQLADLHPEYLDIEWDVPEPFIKEMKHTPVKILLSYHNFQECPKDLEGIFQQIQQKRAHLYKMAVMAHSTSDALRLLLFSQKHAGSLVALCMGPYGQVTRIAAPLFCAPLCYAALEEGQSTASGQLTVQALQQTYHFSSLSPASRLFGLIGNPVDKSLSHDTHNRAMHQLGIDALYVKMQVKEQELADCLSAASQLGFSGLSVTMPLKEQVIPYLDALDPEAEQIGAVNTIVFRDHKHFGYCTDGIGALNSLEELGPVVGKTLLLLGAGGAARAIAFEAVKRGAKVTLFNRTQERAQQVAAHIDSPHCTADAWEAIGRYAERYDILVNATPADLPIDPLFIKPGTLAMDIRTRPVLTPFLQAAQKQGAICIPGYRMFIHQAVEQYRLWLGSSLDAHALLDQLEAAARCALNLTPM